MAGRDQSRSNFTNFHNIQLSSNPGFDPGWQVKSSHGFSWSPWSFRICCGSVGGLFFSETPGNCKRWSGLKWALLKHEHGTYDFTHFSLWFQLIDISLFGALSEILCICPRLMIRGRPWGSGFWWSPSKYCNYIKIYIYIYIKIYIYICINTLYEDDIWIWWNCITAM